MPKKTNPCSKTVSRENAYEVWQSDDGSWTWYVLKKWQTPEQEEWNDFARWYCNVVSPMTSERGETGDVYVTDIKAQARKLDYNPLVSYTVHARHPLSGEREETAERQTHYRDVAEQMFVTLQQTYQAVKLLQEVKMQTSLVCTMLLRHPKE